MKQPIFWSLMIIIFCTCKKDDICPYGTLLDKDELSAEAKNFNPYAPSASHVFFHDENGQEYRFEIERNFIQTSRNFISDFCYEGEFYKIYLKDIGADLFFHIWISDVIKPNPENASGENLSILFSERADTDGTINTDELNLVHSINIRNDLGVPLYTDQTLVHDSLVINGLSYYDVIQNNDNDLDPKYEVYYNTEFGLVGFTNTITNTVYNLDRIE